MTRSTHHLPNDWRAEDLNMVKNRSTASAAEREHTSGAPIHPVSGSPDNAGQPSASSDAYLVSECLKGNEDAWAALIHKYKRLIYSIPLKYGAHPADAADIVQSVCMELFCELSKLRKVESLKSWLIVVTSRKCFHWKRANRPEMTLDNVEQDHPEAIAVSAPELVEAEKEQCLRDAVAQLQPRCQELVRLLFYEQPPLPYAEVARRLGLATGSIGFTRGRCLARLQKILSQMGF
jgi:RNA polymerase sigma factor (sigma-70 family)